jgi:hypothetical protein
MRDIVPDFRGLCPRFTHSKVGDSFALANVDIRRPGTVNISVVMEFLPAESIMTKSLVVQVTFFEYRNTAELGFAHEQ